MKIAKRVTSISVPLVLVVLISASSGSGASHSRGYVEAYLDGIPNAFVLDRPTPVTLKLHNASKIVLKHGFLTIAAQYDVVADNSATCHKLVNEIGAAACQWKVRYVRPGRTATFKLSLVFSSKDYPNATVPGTNLHQVVLALYAQAPRLESFDNNYLPVRITMG